MYEMLRTDGSSCGSNLPNFFSKETHMFNGIQADTEAPTRDDFTSIYRRDDCRSRCFIEATPANIRTSRAPRMLFGLMTEAERAAAKFLLVVREPVSRDISYFNHFHANHQRDKAYNLAVFKEYTRLSLSAWDQCVNGSVTSTDVYERCKHQSSLAIGMYWPQISNWEHYFGKEQLLVISMDAMINEPSVVQHRVYMHLGLKSRSGFSGVFPHRNPTRFPGEIDSIGCATKRSLRNLYNDWNQRLYDAQPSLQAPWAVTAAEGWDRVSCRQGQAAEASLQQPAAVTQGRVVFETAKSVW